MLEIGLQVIIQKNNGIIFDYNIFVIDKNNMKRVVFLLILVLQFSFVNSQENELFHRVKINYNSSENFEKLLTCCVEKKEDHN